MNLLSPGVITNLKARPNSYPLYLDNDCLLTHLYENGYDKQLITIQSFVL
jgi:hypothetical protein